MSSYIANELMSYLWIFRRKLTQESNKDLKSTEERELEIIEAKKKELEARRKLAQESFKAAQSSTAYVPPQSKQPLTRPDDIHFATDGRIKSTHDNKNDKEINFTKLLRHNRSRVSTCLVFSFQTDRCYCEEFKTFLLQFKESLLSEQC